MKKFFSLIVTVLLLFSCSQKPAPISYKGHLKYSKVGVKPHNVAKKVVKPKQSGAVKQSKLKANQIRIKSGDSLYEIAKTHKIPTRSIIEQNNLKPPYNLYAGDILTLPVKQKTHTVVRGDNLTTIARKYNVSISELAQVNNLKITSNIQIGKVLILPYGAKAESNNVIIPKNLAKNFSIPSKNDDFIWPVKGSLIQKFGSKPDGTHNDGINISASFNDPVRAASAGKVVYVGNELRGYGNLIIIKHAGNWLTAYAHNNEIKVAKNQKVAAGEIIATVGSSGNVTKAQLHFGLRKGKKAVDPLKYLK